MFGNFDYDNNNNNSIFDNLEKNENRYQSIFDSINNNSSNKNSSIFDISLSGGGLSNLSFSEGLSNLSFSQGLTNLSFSQGLANLSLTDIQIENSFEPQNNNSSIYQSKAAYLDDNSIANKINYRASNYGNMSLIDKMRGVQANRLNLDSESVSLAESYADKTLDKRVMNGAYNVSITDIYANEQAFEAHFNLHTDGFVEVKENPLIDTDIYGNVIDTNKKNKPNSLLDNYNNKENNSILDNYNDKDKQKTNNSLFDKYTEDKKETSIFDNYNKKNLHSFNMFGLNNTEEDNTKSPFDVNLANNKYLNKDNTEEEKQKEKELQEDMNLIAAIGVITPNNLQKAKENFAKIKNKELREQKLKELQLAEEKILKELEKAEEEKKKKEEELKKYKEKKAKERAEKAKQADIIRRKLAGTYVECEEEDNCDNETKEQNIQKEEKNKMASFENIGGGSNSFCFLDVCIDDNKKKEKDIFQQRTGSKGIYDIDLATLDEEHKELAIKVREYAKNLSQQALQQLKNDILSKGIKELTFKDKIKLTIIEEFLLNLSKYLD